MSRSLRKLSIATSSPQDAAALAAAAAAAARGGPARQRRWQKPGRAFPSHGVSLEFLAGLLADERMCKPMSVLVRGPHLDVATLTTSQLRALARQTRCLSHLPLERERDGYRDEGVQAATWMTRVCAPPRTTAQVLACLVLPEVRRVGGAGSYAKALLAGTGLASAHPTDVVAHTWRMPFADLVGALGAENRQRANRERAKVIDAERERRRAQRAAALAARAAGKAPKRKGGGSGDAERLRVLRRQTGSLLRAEPVLAQTATMTSRFNAGFGLSPVKVRVPAPMVVKGAGNVRPQSAGGAAGRRGRRRRLAEFRRMAAENSRGDGRRGSLTTQTVSNSRSQPRRRPRPGTAPPGKRRAHFADDRKNGSPKDTLNEQDGRKGSGQEPKEEDKEEGGDSNEDDDDDIDDVGKGTGKAPRRDKRTQTNSSRRRPDALQRRREQARARSTLRAQNRPTSAHTGRPFRQPDGGRGGRPMTAAEKLRMTPPPGRRVNMESMWHSVGVGPVYTPRLPFDPDAREGEDEDGGHLEPPLTMIRREFGLTDAELSKIPRGRLNIMLRWARQKKWRDNPFRAMEKEARKKKRMLARIQAKEAREQSRHGRGARVTVQMLRQGKQRWEARRSRRGQKRQEDDGLRAAYRRSGIPPPGSPPGTPTNTMVAKKSREDALHHWLTANPGHGNPSSPSSRSGDRSAAAAAAGSGVTAVRTYGGLKRESASPAPHTNQQTTPSRRKRGRGVDKKKKKPKKNGGNKGSSGADTNDDVDEDAYLLPAGWMPQQRFYWIDGFVEDDLEDAVLAAFADDAAPDGAEASGTSSSASTSPTKKFPARPGRGASRHDTSSTSKKSAAGTATPPKDARYIEHTFPAGLRAVGRTVLVLDALEPNASALTADAWCCWQVYATLLEHAPAGTTAAPSELAVALPPSCHAAFLSSVVRDVHEHREHFRDAVDISKVVVQTSATQGSAAWGLHLRHVLEHKCQGGLVGVGNTIAGAIREWIQRSARHCLEARVRDQRTPLEPAAVELCHYFALLLIRAAGVGPGGRRLRLRGSSSETSSPSSSLSSSSAAASSAGASDAASRTALVHAERLLRRALTDARGTSTSRGVPLKLLVELKAQLAQLLRATGRLTEALPLYQEVFKETRRLYGEGTGETLTAANHLASIMRRMGMKHQAEGVFRMNITSSERAGNEHGGSRDEDDIYEFAEGEDLAGLLQRGRNRDGEDASGDAGEAADAAREQELEDELEGRRSHTTAPPLGERLRHHTHTVVGKIHPDTIQATSNLAGMLLSEGGLDEAERLYRRVLACHSKMLGPKHPHTFLAMFNLAATMAARGDYAGAENYARLSLEGYTQFNLADDVREGIQQLGVILRELDREEEAEEIAGHAGFYWFCGKLMKARS